uniref:DDE_Tnp_1_7 domain-containing protein n=1 Tax=Angiostrongylus cantonensis TaxID=6313 RepID=A0A0K0DC43_ANGCA
MSTDGHLGKVSLCRQFLCQGIAAQCIVKCDQQFKAKQFFASDEAVVLDGRRRDTMKLMLSEHHGSSQKMGHFDSLPNSSLRMYRPLL